MGCEKMADENLHAKHRARMQERVERDGLDSLAEHEALEYLLFLSIRQLNINITNVFSHSIRKNLSLIHISEPTRPY